MRPHAGLHLAVLVLSFASFLPAQSPPPRPMGTVDASASSMLATEHHLFVLRDGVLYQFDVHSLKLLRSHRFDGELTTAKVAEVAAATKPAAKAPALLAAPTQAEMQASVDGALQGLVKHQDDDGRWDSDGFGKHDPESETDGPGSPTHDVSATGLSVLALLGGGNTMRSGPHAKAVKKAVTWLRKQQQENGLFGTNAAHDFIYDHAIATYAVCEAYGLSSYQSLVPTAQKGLDYLESHRNPYAVWRYQPRDNDNDTSVTTWAVQALEAGRFFGLTVNKEALVVASTWYDQVTTPDGRAGYTKAGERSSRLPAEAEKFPPEKGEAMTAAATWARYLLQQTPDKKPVMQASLKVMLDNPPRWEDGHIDAIYWYFGTAAAWQAGGKQWADWSRTLRPLVEHQRTDDHFAGSWDPIGVWDGMSGRVHVTALYALTLATGARSGRMR
jgi:hypothetical protein